MTKYVDWRHRDGWKCSLSSPEDFLNPDLGGTSCLITGRMSCCYVPAALSTLICFSDENARADMKKLPTLPTKVLKEHPSLAYWYAHRKWACRIHLKIYFTAHRTANTSS